MDRVRMMEEVEGFHHVLRKVLRIVEVFERSTGGVTNSLNPRVPAWERRELKVRFLELEE